MTRIREEEEWYKFRPPGVTPNRGIGPPWGAFCQITLTSCLQPNGKRYKQAATALTAAECWHTVLIIGESHKHTQIHTDIHTHSMTHKTVLLHSHIQCTYTHCIKHPLHYYYDDSSSTSHFLTHTTKESSCDTPCCHWKFRWVTAVHLAVADGSLWKDSQHTVAGPSIWLHVFPIPVKTVSQGHCNYVSILYCFWDIQRLTMVCFWNLS